MKQSITETLLIGLLIFLYVGIKAQAPYTIQYTEADGLPSMTVYNVLQDSKGFLWIATENGLCRFDGYEFQLIESPLIEDMDIPGLQIGNNDRVWFWNFAGQLFYIEDDNIHRFNPNGALDSANVYNIYEDADNELWVFKQYLPIHCPTLEECQEINRIDNLEIFWDKIKKNKTPKNVYWFSTHLHSFDDTQIPVLLGKTVMVATPSGKLYSLSNEDLTIYEYKSVGQITPTFELSKGQSIISLYEDKDQNTWINTNKRVLMYDKNKESIQLNFSQFKNVNSINQDKDGNFWFATNGTGLFMLPSTQIITLNQGESPLKDEDIIDIIDIIEYEDNSIAIATRQGYIFVMDIMTNEILKRVNVGGRIKLLSKKASNGNFWITIEGRTSELTKDFLRIGPAYQWGATDFILEKDNAVWFTNENQTIHEIANKSGVYHKNYGQNALLRIATRSHKVIFLPNSDKVLVATKEGLYESQHRTDESKKRTIYNAQGQPINLWIKDLFWDEKEQLLWLATQTKGVIAVKSDTIAYHFSTNNSLVSNNINLIKQDTEGIWVGTNKGLNYINFKTKRIKLFDSGDGLPSNNIKTLYIGKDKVWVGTPIGLAILNQDLKYKTSNVPSIYLSSIQINDRDTAVVEAYHLEHDQNNITFKFVAPAFSNPNRFSYQYRLIGLDTTWTKTNNMEVRFPALNDGNYVFEVTTINNEGIANAKIEQVNIDIKKPYWRTWWFILIFTITSLGLVSLLTFWATQTYRKRQEERISFRRQVTESKMQALQSQMNPHFIFNALNAIQHFFTTNEKELAMLHLNKFAKLIRLIFEYSKERTISLAKEVDFLRLYLELEKLRFGDKVEIDFVKDESIYEVDLFVPPLLIQPIIENAFKHGLLHKEGVGELKVLFTRKNEQKIVCIIEDNGIGRVASKKFKKWQLNEHRSSGIQSTEERIELYNQENIEIPISVKIEDLGTVKEPLGTRVTFEFTVLNLD